MGIREPVDRTSDNGGLFFFMTTELTTLKDLDVSGKTVLVRAGFDVPLTGGRVLDDFRIQTSVPTINYLVSKKCRVIVIAHLGRPDGVDPSFSLLPVAERLASLLGRKLLVLEDGQDRLPDYAIPHIYFLRHDILSADFKSILSGMREKDIVLLENLRFYPGEKKGDEKFSALLAALAEVFVNDAFSASHRDDASVTGVAKLLPAGAGFGLTAEAAALSRLTGSPKQPFVVMMGGVKLADKAPALLRLARSAGSILLGGGLGNLFLKVRGYEIGKSVCAEKDEAAVAKQMLRDYADKIKLPSDVVVSGSRDGQPEVASVDKVRRSQMILDIGPQTILEYSGELKGARSLLWSGALGYFENPAFSHGTFALARLFASRCRGVAYGVAGGGETVEVIQKLKLTEFVDYVSTGGGAMLDFLADKPMP